ncbi:MAG: Holliday junction resolvase RuvX [Puniceicoccales bacterium]|jgi:putative Holliday junction resolvase|nr:Holliday junction resolvase RuvX [Puniceicoccales bacterium]
MNYLGIDYGRKRIGLSVGDDELRLAVGLGAILVKDWREVMKEIVKIVESRKIDKIIVGYPINLNGHIGKAAEEVDRFIKDLNEVVGVKIERMDERLTSEGVGDMRKRSPKKRRKLRKKGEVDKVAAVLILQDYFDREEA